MDHHTLMMLKLLLLLMVANGAPILAQRILKHRWNTPVDGGRLWRDGHRVLGSSKTWRGLTTGLVSCAIVAGLLGYSVLFGVLFGTLSLLGDLASSFTKRRLGLAASARASGLDQIPEALLPMIVAAIWLDFGARVVLLVTALFTAANILLSPQLYRWGIRRKPH